MARKYDLISELYDRTCASVSENPLNWQGLLRTASYNFRLRFDEQLLLYAQRPDATAVLPIERWNGSFGRWVNRGAKGIAVFEDENRQRQRLTHYFDISDTHGSRYARPVPLWQMKLEYESDVAETLENTFGEADDNSTLESIIEGCVGNCALPGFVDSKNEEKTERNAGYLVVSHSGGGMLRQGTRKGIRRTPANRGMRAHRVVKGLDISEDVCHGMCP